MNICDKVFVYGTLQQGYGNNRLLKDHDADCLGTRVTADKYVLGDVGFPYALTPEAVEGRLEEEMFRPVEGELWSIPNEDCLASLDRLEGNGHHYTREVIQLSTGEEAWMYLQPDWQVLYHCTRCTITEEGNYKW